MQSDDPTVIRVLAVHTDDIVTALEANERRDTGTVLRVTPPFAGRMRARLHRAGHESPYGDPAPIHIDPAALTDVPAFPTPDDVEDELRASDEPYSPERHEAWYADAVERWRDAARAGVRDELTISTPDGSHSVRISTLG
ncbi:hypothetical protein [Natronomonas sp. EA1]|uniref:hypothetical protein n=1 Tax=Natronomonas sp. EA1 TaxID=3421655 RepID=UPI003EBA8B3B